MAASATLLALLAPHTACAQTLSSTINASGSVTEESSGPYNTTSIQAAYPGADGYPAYGVIQFNGGAFSFGGAVTAINSATISLVEAPSTSTSTHTSAGTVADFYLTTDTTTSLTSTAGTYVTANENSGGVPSSVFQNADPGLYVGAITYANVAQTDTLTLTLSTADQTYIENQINNGNNIRLVEIVTSPGSSARFDVNYASAAFATLGISADVPVLAKTLLYTANTNNSFDTTTNNFTPTGGGAATNFTTLSSVTFSNTGVGSVTVATGGVQPSSTTISNTTGSYTFTGGPIVGGSFLKTGSTLAVLQNSSNTYGGATTINGGTLQAGAANVFSPNSLVTVTANATANGVLDLNGFPNTLGGLTLNGGTVTIGAGALTTPTITTASTSYQTNTISASTGSIVVPSAGLPITLVHSASLTSTPDLEITSPFSGTGKVTFAGTGTVSIGANNSGYGGAVQSSGVTVNLENNTALGTNVIDLNGGTISASTPLTGNNALPVSISLGNNAAFSGQDMQFSGTGSFADYDSGSISYANVVSTYNTTTLSVEIEDPAPFSSFTYVTSVVKGGTGTLVLDTAEANTGTYGVSAGTLIFDANASAALATGATISANSANSTLLLQNGSALPAGTPLTFYGSSVGYTGALSVDGLGSNAALSFGTVTINGSTAGKLTALINVAETGDSVTLTGPLTNGTAAGLGAAIVKSGAGALVLSGAMTNATGASLANQAGTVTFNVDGGPNLPVSTLAGSSTIFAAGQSIPSLSNAGAASFTAGTSTIASITGAGSLSVAGGTTLNTGSLAQGPIVSAGTLNVTGSSTTTVGTVEGAGTFNVSGTTNLTATHIVQSALSVGAGSTVTIATLGTNASTSNVASLALSSTGTLDLKNNDLIVSYGSAASPLTTIQASLAQAYDGGAYDKPGLTSSTAAAAPNTFRLAYAEASALGSTSFDGQTLSGNAVLVKYTLAGDTKLTGKVGLQDYNTVVANYNTGTLWTQGDFHYTGTTGLADYNAVVANYNATAPTTHALVGPVQNSITNNLVAMSTSPMLHALALTPAALSASDLRLEVNTTTGDISVLNVSGGAVSFTGYNIQDLSGNLLDSGNDNAGDPTNELLLSVSAAAGGNPTTYRSATNYRNWTEIQDNQSALSESQSLSRYKSGTTSTYDDISIPASGTIDFGNIYGGGADLAFTYAEAVGNSATGDPVNGPTFTGGIDYMGSATPEPSSMVLFGASGFGLLARRRRRAAAAAK